MFKDICKWDLLPLMKYNGHFYFSHDYAIYAVKNLLYLSSNNQFCLPSNSLRVGDCGDSTKSAMASTA